MTQKPTIMRNMVVEPTGNTAGVAVAHVENAPPHSTEYQIEQVWSNGDVDTVYLGDKDDALELIKELTRVLQREE